MRTVKYSLSPTRINNAKAKPKPYKLTDGAGLYVAVSASGTKTWRFQYRFGGEREEVTIGRYPEIGVADARDRDRHFEYRAAQAGGENPSEIRRNELEARKGRNSAQAEQEKLRVVLTPVVLKRLRQLAGSNPLPEVRLLLADLYADLKDFGQAAKFFESVVPSDGVSELHTRLLYCLLRSGNRRKAKNLLERLPDGWIANDKLRRSASELARDAGDWPLLSRLAEAQFASHPGEIGSWLFKYMVDHRELPASDLKAFIERAPLQLEGTIQPDAAQWALLEAAEHAES